jgi:protein-tyrosine phosphatase
MEFAPPGLSDVVVDPYYSGERGFEMVLDHVEAACRGLLAHLRQQLAVSG